VNQFVWDPQIQEFEVVCMGKKTRITSPSATKVTTKKAKPNLSATGQLEAAGHRRVGG